MQQRSKLLAWVAPQSDDEVVAAFVGGAAPSAGAGNACLRLGSRSAGVGRA
jgi:hypothetical protein